MNHQPAVQPKASSNGFGRRRVEKEVGTRSDNRLQSVKSNSGRGTNTGALVGGKVGGSESSSRDRLVYLTTCLIGHPVEVQVKNGTVYTGIFHATNTEKEFGIIIKMARMTRDGTLRGQKAISEFVSKGSSKTLIIPAKELVQVIAKDVAVTRDELSNELQNKQQELMTDSFISQSRHNEGQRELAPWVPDEDDPQCPELDNIFDGPWNRGWDQFETNELLFGVKSTFNEELYTTKLERGPQLRQWEREAMRIAREIEGEESHDLHIAEERGFQLEEERDIDEETKYSSVYRGRAFDDSGYDEEEDIVLDSRNTETFGDSSASISKKPADVTSSLSNDGGLASSSSLVDDPVSMQSNTGTDLNGIASHDHSRYLAPEISSRNLSSSAGESMIQASLLEEHGRKTDTHSFVEKQKPGASEFPLPSAGDSGGNLVSSDKGGQHTNASIRLSSKSSEKQISPGEQSGGSVSGKKTGESKTLSSTGKPGSYSTTRADRLGAVPSSGPGLSPSSSVGSFSSEKSTLNPNAKEFRLNPNAKSFKPSPSAARPPSPVSDASFYYPTGIPAVPHLHSASVGYGMGSSYPGHQPVMYSPQVAPMQQPQAYFHPNGSQYGQQMLLGQPRPLLYMPYQPEMQYKGREY